MTRTQILEAIRTFCEAHPFYMNDRKRNETHNENGDHDGFLGYFPNLCSVIVTERNTVLISIEYCGVTPSVELVQDGWYSWSVDSKPEQKDLTRKQIECTGWVASELIKILNAATE